MDIAKSIIHTALFMRKNFLYYYMQNLIYPVILTTPKPPSIPQLNKNLTVNLLPLTRTPIHIISSALLKYLHHSQTTHHTPIAWPFEHHHGNSPRSNLR
jgi:hypothetical protein